MRNLTILQIENMDLEAARAEISSRVYEAALLLERLEDVGKVRGNGHHMAQALAAQAADLVAERWVTKEPVKPSERTDGG